MNREIETMSHLETECNFCYAVKTPRKTFGQTICCLSATPIRIAQCHNCSFQYHQDCLDYYVLNIRNQHTEAGTIDSEAYNTELKCHNFRCGHNISDLVTPGLPYTFKEYENRRKIYGLCRPILNNMHLIRFVSLQCIIPVGIIFICLLIISTQGHDHIDKWCHHLNTTNQTETCISDYKNKIPGLGTSLLMSLSTQTLFCVSFGFAAEIDRLRNRVTRLYFHSIWPHTILNIISFIAYEIILFGKTSLFDPTTLSGINYFGSIILSLFLYLFPYLYFIPAICLLLISVVVFIPILLIMPMWSLCSHIRNSIQAQNNYGYHSLQPIVIKV